MTKVKLENFLSSGSVGQFFRRDPANAKGGEWRDDQFPDENGGQVTAAFGTGAANVTVSVTDLGIRDTSIVFASVGVPSSRAQDELELEPMVVNRGAVTPSGGFDVIVSPVNPDSRLTGDYTVHWTRK